MLRWLFFAEKHSVEERMGGRKEGKKEERKEKNLSYLLFNLNHGQRLALQVSLRGTKLPGDDMEAVTGLHGQIKGCNAHFYSITQCACYTA